MKTNLKYLLILSAMIGFLVVLALIFMGCEKVEDEYCWHCQIAVYYRTARYTEIKYVYKDTCGFSETDARKYERLKTTSPRVVNNCGDRRWMECICVKNN
jgi:hypothetical protein